MGTPEFAVASLEAIHKSGHEVVAVVTAPDKPAGRGQNIKFSEVKEYAVAHGFPILQPEKLRDHSFVAALRDLHADLFVVVAFRMLPEEVYTIPPLGTFNVHASLLPDYRGAAPIHWAVMNGEKKSGVTTFFLNREIDKGDIIDKTEVEIEEYETTGELYEKLMYEGAKLAIKTISAIENKKIKLISQQDIDEQTLHPAPKILKQDTLIDWNTPAQQIFNKIRGLSPYPGAFTRIKNKSGDIFFLKCYKASISDEMSDELPGKMHTDGRNFLFVNTADFRIFLENVQLQGKSKMKIEDFLPGFRLENFSNILF